MEVLALIWGSLYGFAFRPCRAGSILSDNRPDPVRREAQFRRITSNTTITRNSKPIMRV